MLTTVEERGVTFVEGTPGAPLMHSANEASTVLEACFSSGARAALLYGANLPAEFFDLSSTQAGHILQKLRNYGVRLAVVHTSDDTRTSSRFGEMVAEEQRGSDFAMFVSRGDAVEWLVEE